MPFLPCSTQSICFDSGSLLEAIFIVKIFRSFRNFFRLIWNKFCLQTFFVRCGTYFVRQHLLNLIPRQHEEQQQKRTTKLLLGPLSRARGQKLFGHDTSPKALEFSEKEANYF